MGLVDRQRGLKADSKKPAQPDHSPKQLIHGNTQINTQTHAHINPHTLSRKTLTHVETKTNIHCKEVAVSDTSTVHVEDDYIALLCKVFIFISTQVDVHKQCSTVFHLGYILGQP